MFCITEQGSAILHKAYYRRTSITFVGTDVLAFTINGCEVMLYDTASVSFIRKLTEAGSHAE